LKELRDSAVFAFIMINALFVLIVFLLQLNKDNIHVKWPLGVKTNITYDETTQEVTPRRHQHLVDGIDAVLMPPI
jgi:chitin synthase